MLNEDLQFCRNEYQALPVRQKMKNAKCMTDDLYLTNVQCSASDEQRFSLHHAQSCTTLGCGMKDRGVGMFKRPSLLPA